MSVSNRGGWIIISKVKPTGFDEEGKRKGSTGDLTKIFILTIRKVEFPFSLHKPIKLPKMASRQLNVSLDIFSLEIQI